MTICASAILEAGYECLDQNCPSFLIILSNMSCTSYQVGKLTCNVASQADGFSAKD